MDQNPATRLNELLASAGLPVLDSELARKFESYLELLVRWNARMNLTAIRDTEGILSRHFVECIACARLLPGGIETLLDFGSGAGFPGIPIALCRPEIEVTLAESQSKKAGFLREVLRTLALKARVFSGRAEKIDDTFGCVVLRAVDQMEEAILASMRLIAPGGWLGILTTGSESGEIQRLPKLTVEWLAPLPLPLSEDRVLMLGRRSE